MTLTPFLGKISSGDKRAEALNRVVGILLQGIARHGFQYDRDACSRFESAIRKIRTSFDEPLEEDAALLLAASATGLMEEHNDSAVSHMRARSNEMESVFAMLSETLFEVAKPAPPTMVRMKEIERDLALATSPAETDAAKKRLANCLSDLKKDLRTNQPKPPRVTGTTDLLTGLPDSGAARGAIDAVWGFREKYYVTIVVLERLEAINVRFGYKTGDEMLLILSQHLAQHTAPVDQLFRWRGPCLVTLIERDNADLDVKAELSSMLSVRIEHRIKMKGRELVLPLSTSCATFPLRSVATTEELMLVLNGFAGTRTHQVMSL